MGACLRFMVACLRFMSTCLRFVGDCLRFIGACPGPDLSMGKVGSCPGPPHFRGPPQNQASFCEGPQMSVQHKKVNTRIIQWWNRPHTNQNSITKDRDVGRGEASPPPLPPTSSKSANDTWPLEIIIFKTNLQLHLLNILCHKILQLSYLG